GADAAGPAAARAVAPHASRPARPRAHRRGHRMARGDAARSRRRALVSRRQRQHEREREPMSEDEIEQLRRWYADELRVVAPIRRNPAVVAAFRAVPREHFFGAGPWRLITPRFSGADYVTPDAELHWLYHDVLVSLDPARRL